MQPMDCRSPHYLHDFLNLYPDQSDITWIARSIIEKTGGPDEIESFFGPKLRQSLDEVIDMPRTGRYCLAQTEKTEKTYVGTKVEIVLRHELNLERGHKLDARINGYEVDIKNTTGKNWMIPREAINEICLLTQTSEQNGTFSVGLLRCSEETLSLGGNRDLKKSVSASGRRRILWLVKDGQMPENVFLHMNPATRERIFSAGGATRRLAELFRTMTGTIIHRYLVESVSQQLDYMKRLRRNGGAQDILDEEGLEILWGGRKQDNEAAQLAGYRPLSRDEFICLRKADIGLRP
ncbi:MAG: type 2 restriction enzyme naeI [Marinobacter sp. T13-3]|nr:MAG: type 2 restriction enzyme naeI [Marinobacter sp. T13-3]